MFLKNLLRNYSISVMVILSGLMSSWNAFAQTTSLVGVVLDEMDVPMPGVFVYDAANKGGGTMTSDKGSYKITVSSKCKNLTFEIMGYKTQVVPIGDATIVKLVPDSEMLQDVVVTGIYTRKAESFTGAVQSVTNEELKRVSNSNLFQSLQTLDPSLMVFDNLSQGSNPNAVASMQLRGASSFASESSDMKNPNTPLFILDGFEASLEKIQDLDMNRIESITILKDASAKAIYGSKAGNGVIVIETKSLRSGQTAVSYYGSLQVQMPDLTSYNLCNALEKLEIERREGYYESGMTSGNVAISIPGAYAEIMNIYYERLKRAMEGESTYWLSKPLHTSFDQKHTLEVELGTKDLKTMATLSFKDTPGVMMGSFRDNISGDITTSYRLGKWQFRNIMSYAKMWSEESPYGTFSDYTLMNPYDNPYDANGNVVKSFYVSVLGSKVVTALNPMYNATINTKSSDEYIDFTDNMYVEYQMFKSLKLVGRFGVENKRGTKEEFRPSDHTDFIKFDLAELMNRRGAYMMDSSQSSKFSGDVSAQFNKTLNGKHDIFATAQYTISETKSSNVRIDAEGFPNSKMNSITFARQYAEGTTPSGSASLSRSLGFLLTTGYSYMDRYMFDGTIKASASSVFGTNNRWGTFWSTGVAWNVHNEEFMKNVKWLRQLKFRGSVGTSGNQNYAATMSVPIYRYNNKTYYDGFTGAGLVNMRNPDLGWEKKMDWNVGLDFRTKRLSLISNIYVSDTKNLVFQRSILPSTGFAAVSDNLGKVRNKGIEASINYRFFERGASYMSVFSSIAANDNRILEISDVLRNYNKEQQDNATANNATAPVIQYYDGVPMNSIWVVPSLGIDPVTGKEIFVKKDGSITNSWSATDLENYGSEDPLFNGSVGINGEIKGIGINFTGSFYGGGYSYNSTLVDKVENVSISSNVDKRIYSGRWYYPGQEAQYKNGIKNLTRPTSRFVQKNNVFKLASASIYYEFPYKALEKMKMQRLRVTLYANDIETFSSIKVERGTSYPFARSFTLSVTATF